MARRAWSSRPWTARARYLVYAVRDGGQDEHALRIRDLTTNQDLPDHFPAGPLQQRGAHDRGRRLLLQHPFPARPAPASASTWLEDRTPPPTRWLFGNGDGPTAFVSVLLPERRRRAGSSSPSNTPGPTTDVFALDMQGEGRHARLPWPRAWTRASIRGSSTAKLWMRTDLDAPKNRVVAVNLRQPGAGAVARGAGRAARRARGRRRHRRPDLTGTTCTTPQARIVRFDIRGTGATRTSTCRRCTRR